MFRLAVLWLTILTYTGNIIAETINFADPSIEGRWDITVDKGDKKVPSWLEVRTNFLLVISASVSPDLIN